MVEVFFEFDGVRVEPSDITNASLAGALFTWEAPLHKFLDPLPCPVCGESANIKVVVGMNFGQLGLRSIDVCHAEYYRAANDVLPHQLRIRTADGT